MRVLPNETAAAGEESAHRTSPERARPFFPATCHPVFSRRQFLVGAGTVLAAGRLGRRDALAGQAPDDGAAIIRRYAVTPEDPWAVAHGLRGIGRDFTINGGRRAIDYLLEDVLVTLPANGKGALGFPIEVEAHPNMFLKTLLEAGVPLDHAFTHEGRRRTLRDVVDGARGLFRPTLVSSVPNALPWSLIALTRPTPPLRQQWTNAWGETVALDLVVERALRLLEQASGPLVEAMRAGRPETAQAPVHGFTCGGTHMLYALLSAVHAGYTGKDRRERVQQQVDLLVWRLSADLDFIERFYGARAGTAGASWYALDAKLKLLGHGAECLAFATLHDVVGLTPSQRERRQAAVATLRSMLRDLETRDLGEAQALDRELYRQLIGDVCHARHGLTLA
ncbi:MAG TPA: hypothetical protein VGV06_09350 [Methylomirabilota bacterium]|nr:hypothetical protein [Methylomirabilota bacterium]